MRRLMIIFGWAVVALGVACTLVYPAGLWWDGRVLANEIRTLDHFEIVDYDDRTLSLLRSSGMGQVTLADLTVQQTRPSSSSPARNLERALRRTGRRVNEQQTRADGMDADVIWIVDENVDDDLIQVRLELHDSDAIGAHMVLFFGLVGVLTVIAGRVVLALARPPNAPTPDAVAAPEVSARSQDDLIQ